MMSWGTQNKPVIMTDASGVETEYVSQAAAVKATGLSQTSVSNMCRGVKPAVVKGYRARFKESVVSETTPPPTERPPEVGV